MGRPLRGQGYVRQRGNAFEAAWQKDGRRYTKSFKEESEAWDYIGTLKTDSVREVLGVDERPEAPPFDDLCRYYKFHKLKRWKQGTIRFFDGHRKLLVGAFRSRKVDEITTAELQSFVDRQLGRVSPGTVKKYIQVLNQVFNYAVRMKWLIVSPMKDVEGVTVERGEKRIFTLAEIQSIFRACNPSEMGFVAILFFYGLREAEMYRLTWEWPRFDKGDFRVLKPKRGTIEDNTLPMIPFVQKALEALGPKASGPVFPGRRRSGGDAALAGADAAVHLSNKRKMLHSILARAGIESTGIGFHTFRHTLLTMVERLPGATFSKVRNIARHSKKSNQSVTSTYLHATMEECRELLLELERRVMCGVFPGYEISTVIEGS